MVSKCKFLLLVVFSIVLFVLAACKPATPTEDPVLKITSIAATVQAEITQTALAMPTTTPTQTSTATMSSTSTLTSSLVTPTRGMATSSAGDDAKFDQDITIPDGSIIKPGAGFNKTWSIINTGTTTWTKDYQLIFVDGFQATTLGVKLTKNVAPGEAVQITVPFVASSTIGSYYSWWQMYSANGFGFGEQVSVVFNVGNETPTPTSGTPTITGTPATATPTSTTTN